MLSSVTELPLSSTLYRPITDNEIKIYQRDGIVCLRAFFKEEWVKHLREMTERVIANPSPMHKPVDTIKTNGGGSFFFDAFLSHYMKGFRTAAFSSPAAEIAGTLMGSSKVNLLFDQLLVKEPGALSPTLWHHDATYWPVAGTQVSTVWLALDPVTYDTGAVEYIKGSHLWGERYLAVSFNPEETYSEDLPNVPDIDNNRDDYEIVWFELEPGDCTIHHALTLHGAPGNQSSTVRRRAYVTRWTGDDVTYYPRPNLMRIPRDPGIEPGSVLDCDLFPVVWRSANFS